MTTLTHLQVRNPKDDETPIEAATQIFASVLSYPYIPLWKFPIVHPKPTSFELYLLDQTVYFYVTAPSAQEAYAQSLISSSFPASALKKTTDPLEIIFKSPHVAVGEVVLNSYFHFPIKTYFDFKDIDPLSTLIGFLSKQSASIRIGVQIVVTPATFPWQSQVVEAAKKQSYDAGADRYSQNPQKMLIMRKAAFQGGRASVRLIVGADTPVAMTYLRNVAGAFGSFSLGEGNQFVFKRPYVLKDRLIKKIRNRTLHWYEKKHQILNAQELATLWHPPGYLLSGIRNIAWGKTLSGEPPENLPVASTSDDSDQTEATLKLRESYKNVNFFAKTEFKNQETIFGIKTEDRRKHVYIIGKTGAGKSTLIANMAIDDIRKDRGIAIIDPHGDLSSIILDYIPKRRLNDVVYLEPFDTARPFSLNVLEIKNKQHKDLVASGIVSIFYKLYGDSWGPRLEYILRNIILTLLEVPGSTLVDVLTLISDARYFVR